MSNLFPMTAAELRLRNDLGTDVLGLLDAHAKLDLIKTETADILADTSSMDTRLGTSANTGTIAGDIAAIQASVTSISGDSTDILAELANATYGLSALEVKLMAVDTVVDTINTKIGSPAVSLTADVAAVKAETALIKLDTTETLSRIGTPTLVTIAAEFDALNGKMNSLQNNTRTTIGLFEQLELPATGNVDYVITLNNYNDVGAMEDPDSSVVSVSVATAAGVDRSAKLISTVAGEMNKLSTGRYQIKYRVASTDAADEGLIFTFTLVEGGVTRIVDRISRTTEEISSTFTATDRATLAEIVADTAEIQPDVDQAILDIAAVKSVVDTIHGVVDNVEVDTQDIQASLALIESKDGSLTYDRSTDSLEAISEAVAALVAQPSASTHFRYVKPSASLAQGASEIVVLDVDSENLNIKEVRCTTPAAITNFAVEIFEDSACTTAGSLMKYEKANQVKGDLKLATDLIFVNRNSTVEKKVYVKVTNNHPSALAGVFTVELRGITLQANA